MRPIEERPYFEKDILQSDFLQNVTSLKIARRWVDETVAESRPIEVMRYVEVFLNMRPISRRRRGKKGGAIDDQCDDENDPRIYRLLALADSIHDSHSRDFGQTPQSIMGYMKMSPGDLPKGLTPAMLNKEEDVIQFLLRRKNLRFKREDVDNPLHGADLAHFDVQAAQVVTPGPHSDVLTATYRRAAQAVQRMGNSRSKRMLCAPVYSVTETRDDQRPSNIRRIQLVQLLDLAAHMRNAFGQRCVFQPDAYHPLLRFVAATKFIDQAFFDKFVIDKDYHVLKYEHEIRQAIAIHHDSIKTDWQIVLCDANYFDGASIQDPVKVETGATGWVFRHGIDGISHHNIRLEGISPDDKLKYSEYWNNKFAAKLISRDMADATSSTAAVFSQLPGANVSLGVKSNAECSRLLNRKRAGDWGQVESCKRSRRILLTSDRLAALYAYYRGVPFMLLKIHDYPELGSDMMQYSCCIGRGI